MRKKHNKSELPIKLIKTDRRKKKDKQNYAEPLYIGEGRFLLSIMKQNNTERRGGEDESFLLTDVIKKFIQRTENERKAEKARWLPLYEIIYDELGDEYYQEQGQTRTRKAFTVAELQEALEFMMIGNKVIIRCLNSVIRFELYCLRNYILDRLNAESKTFITKLIFC